MWLHAVNVYFLPFGHRCTVCTEKQNVGQGGREYQWQRIMNKVTDLEPTSLIVRI